MLQCVDPNSACVWYRSQRAHSHAQNVKFYHFKTVFSLQKCEANSDSTWQTGTYDCKALSHQVKSEFASQKLLSYFTFKIPSFSQFLMAIARCCNSSNLNTSSLRNVRRAGLETSSGFWHTNFETYPSRCRQPIHISKYSMYSDVCKLFIIHHVIVISVLDRHLCCILEYRHLISTNLTKSLTRKWICKDCFAQVLSS